MSSYDCSSEHPIVDIISSTKRLLTCSFVFSAACKKKPLIVDNDPPPVGGNVCLNKSSNCSNWFFNSFLTWFLNLLDFWSNSFNCLMTSLFFLSNDVFLRLSQFFSPGIFSFFYLSSFSFFFYFFFALASHLINS